MECTLTNLHVPPYEEQMKLVWLQGHRIRCGGQYTKSWYWDVMWYSRLEMRHGNSTFKMYCENSIHWMRFRDNRLKMLCGTADLKWDMGTSDLRFNVSFGSNMGTTDKGCHIRTMLFIMVLKILLSFIQLSQYWRSNYWQWHFCN